MLIKELEDMLVLVRQLPRADQLKCVQALWSHVVEWEERQQEPHLSDAEWRALQTERAAAQRVREELRQFDDMGISIEPRSGIVASFDGKKGYGYIEMDGGERALLHVTCLRASGYRHAKKGASIEFLAMRRTRGWQAFRILSLADE
jgi:cold shock CspA family protein